MSRQPFSIKHETLMKVKDSVCQMAKECEQKKPAKIVPPRLKKLTEALDLATNESDQWKELHHARKNKYNTAKMGEYYIPIRFLYENWNLGSLLTLFGPNTFWPLLVL